MAVGLVTFDRIEKAELIGSELGLVKYVVERGSGLLRRLAPEVAQGAAGCDVCGTTVTGGCNDS